MPTQPLVIRAFLHSDEQAVLDIWTQCDLIHEWNDPRKDIERKVNTQPDLFLVGARGSELVCTVMGGYDGHRGSINYLAVKPSYQRQDCGRLIMAEVERRLQGLGCAKVNLLVRRSNLDVVTFYNRLGYEADEVISLGKRLSQPTFER
jgi:ribosomal protein S18 acetylase RimI-like enzyme